MLRFGFLIFVVLYSVNCFSQNMLSVNRQKLKPRFVDTVSEKYISLESKATVIYFKQSDVAKHLSNSGISLAGKAEVQFLLDTLKTAVRSIKIFQTDVVNDNSLNQKLSNSFYFIAAELMVKNQFMLLLKQANKVNTRHLKVKKVKGLLGAEYLSFLFKGKEFYNVVTAFGE